MKNIKMPFVPASKNQIADWDKLVCKQMDPHFLQSSAWADFKKSNGWQPLYLLDAEHGIPVLVLQRKIPFLGYLFYIPKGPCLDFELDQNPTLTSLLTYLTTSLSNKPNVLQIKVEIEAKTNNTKVLDVFSAHGFEASDYHPQFKKTSLIDLVQDTDSLLNSFRSKTRYNIKLAKKKGVEIKQESTPQTLKLFFDMYEQTGQRGNFPVRSFEYYRTLWSAFVQKGMAELFLAYHEDEPLAGLLLFKYNNRCFYQYGASFAKKQNLMPNYLLQWHAMLWAIHNGCTVYDMVGLPEKDDPEDPFSGVWRFKRGFNGSEVEYLGAMDYYPNAWKKIFWEKTQKYYKKFLWYTKKQILY